MPKALPPIPASAPAPPPVVAPAKKGKAAAKPSGPPQIKLYNYEFTAPWPGNSQIKPGPTYSQVRFDSGQVIVFFDPESQIDTIREMKTQNAADYQRLTNVFGDQTPDSDYALYQAAYAASPAQTSPFISRANAVRINGALLYKLGFGYDALPGIESFELGKNHGFEFGDAASGRPIAARVFNDRDDQFRFIFTTAAGSGAKITQDDMNLVMESLQPVPLLER